MIAFSKHKVCVILIKNIKYAPKCKHLLSHIYNLFSSVFLLGEPHYLCENTGFRRQVVGLYPVGMGPVSNPRLTPVHRELVVSPCSPEGYSYRCHFCRNCPHPRCLTGTAPVLIPEAGSHPAILKEKCLRRISLELCWWPLRKGLDMNKAMGKHYGLTHLAKQKAAERFSEVYSISIAEISWDYVNPDLCGMCLAPLFQETNVIFVHSGENAFTKHFWTPGFGKMGR